MQNEKNLFRVACHCDLSINPLLSGHSDTTTKIKNFFERKFRFRKTKKFYFFGFGSFRTFGISTNRKTDPFSPASSPSNWFSSSEPTKRF